MMSVVRVVRETLPYMRGAGRGRIVNLASSVKQPVENLILSNTFRIGIAGLVKSLFFELAPEGLLVNTLVQGAPPPNARPRSTRQGRKASGLRSRRYVPKCR